MSTDKGNDNHDTWVVDVIATVLGTSEEWSGADMLEVIADVIGTVRPRPGSVPAEVYGQAFREATGRDVVLHLAYLAGAEE